MAFRILKLARYYQAALDQFYASQPGLAAQAYDEQHAALMAACFSTADFYATAFNNLGYETCELVGNSEPMQKRWAEEHGYSYDGEHWPEQIVTAQIKAFRPEVLYVEGGASILKAAHVQKLRADCPSLRLTMVVNDAPAPEAYSTFREYDMVISNTPEIVAHWQQRGLTAQLVYYAFEPRILDRIDTSAPPHVDFGFVGSIMQVDGYHHAREQLLAQLVRKIDLQVWSNVRRVTTSQIVAQRARQWSYDVVHRLQDGGVPQGVLRSMPYSRKVLAWPQRPAELKYPDQRIARRAHDPVYGLAMYQLLQSMKVALNIHIDISANSASNMRLYEATGVGSCLLTDWKDDLPMQYEPETEVVAYRSVEECVEKAQYLLDHEDERKRIAAAGQKRTLRDHTVAHRVERLHEIISTFMRSH